MKPNSLLHSCWNPMITTSWRSYQFMRVSLSFFCFFWFFFFPNIPMSKLKTMKVITSFWMPTLFINNLRSTDKFDLIPKYLLFDTKNHSSDISFNYFQFFPHLFSIWFIINLQLHYRNCLYLATIFLHNLVFHSILSHSSLPLWSFFIWSIIPSF